MVRSGMTWGERVIYWVIIVGLIAVLLLYRQAALPVALFVNGEPIAWVSNARLARRAVEIAREKLRQRYGNQVDFAETVETGNLPLGDGQKLLSPADAASALLRRVTPAQQAWLIVVNNKPLLALPNKQEADQALDLVKDHFTPEGTMLVKKPNFKEKVVIREGKIAPDRLVPDAETAAQKLIAGLEPPRYHIVKSGEVAVRIARRYGLTLADLQKLNPDRDLNRLQIGDRLLIGRGKPLMTVISIHQVVTKEPVPYKVERRLAPHLPGGALVTKQRGKEGVKEVVMEVVYENGVETQRRVVKEQVLKKPVTEVLLVGGGLR